MKAMNLLMVHLLALVIRFWWQLTLVLVAAVCLLTLWPADKMVDVSGNDKVYHLVAYLSLAFSAALVRPRLWLWLMLGLVLLGGTIELIQPYVLRTREFSDFLANTVGVGLGMTLAALCRWWWPQALGLGNQKADH